MALQHLFLGRRRWKTVLARAVEEDEGMQMQEAAAGLVVLAKEEEMATGLKVALKNLYVQRLPSSLPFYPQNVF